MEYHDLQKSFHTRPFTPIATPHEASKNTIWAKCMEGIECIEDVKELLQMERSLELSLAVVQNKLHTHRASNGEAALRVFFNHYEVYFKLLRCYLIQGKWRSCKTVYFPPSRPFGKDCMFPLMFLSKSFYNLGTAIIEKCTIQFVLQMMSDRNVPFVYCLMSHPYFVDTIGEDVFRPNNHLVQFYSHRTNIHLVTKMMIVATQSSVFSCRLEYSNNFRTTPDIDLYLDYYANDDETKYVVGKKFFQFKYPIDETMECVFQPSSCDRYVIKMFSMYTRRVTLLLTPDRFEMDDIWLRKLFSAFSVLKYSRDCVPILQAGMELLMSSCKDERAADSDVIERFTCNI